MWLPFWFVRLSHLMWYGRECLLGEENSDHAVIHASGCTCALLEAGNGRTWFIDWAWETREKENADRTRQFDLIHPSHNRHRHRYIFLALYLSPSTWTLKWCKTFLTACSTCQALMLMVKLISRWSGQEPTWCQMPQCDRSHCCGWTA